MPKQKAKQKVSLVQPNAYISAYYVNRYFVAHEDGFTVAYFGLMNKDGDLLDKFACVFSASTLAELRENLVTYADKLPSSTKTSPQWKPRATDFNLLRELPNFPVVDFVHLSFGEDTDAEISFWNYSRASLSDRMRASQSVDMPTWGVALLRCGIELQRGFLESLYPV
jgi:hypothetical protein